MHLISKMTTLIYKSGLAGQLVDSMMPVDKAINLKIAIKAL